jgi:hypothetical protein
MSRGPTREDFEAAIVGALDLLGAPDRSLPVPLDPAGHDAPPLPGLLAQCQALVAAATAPAAPVRCLHHLACTGGTLIARCIGALPNTRVLSEVDPLSTHAKDPRAFFPTDLIRLARTGTRPPAPGVLAGIFRAGLDVLLQDGRRHGLDLVLRDHAHSLFCHGADLPDRPTLREILAPAHALRGVVTLRHPVDSYLSLEATGWLHFEPPTLEEYARRYHAFLDRHADLPWIRYEDFLAGPEAAMARICDALELRYDPGFRERFAAVRLSGDSGRAGDVIAPRPRRPCPEALLAQARAPGACSMLLERLGYAGP